MKSYAAIGMVIWGALSVPAADPIVAQEAADLVDVPLWVAETETLRPAAGASAETSATDQGDFAPAATDQAMPGHGEPASGELETPRPISQAPISQATIRQYLDEASAAPRRKEPFQPWWQPAVSEPLQLADRWVSVDGETLILDALRHSFRVAAARENVRIARTAVARAAADFDPTAFLDSKFVRTSLPTGSALDAGANVDRLREEDFSVSSGVRRRTLSGGRLEFGQEIGLRDSNSLFFTPPSQGNSRLTLSFNQPLLNGSGKAFNRSLIVLAELDTQIAQQSSQVAIANHLMSVQEAMWDLHLRRATLLLRIRYLQQAREIHQWLQRRESFDALASQVKRASAAVASRRSELARSVAAIRNAEDQLRALVNAPELTHDHRLEIIPTSSPRCAYAPVRIDDAMVTALQERSEIDELARELDAARVRLRVARNELMPMLDLVLESYVSGLRGQNDVGGAWIDQFSVGEPSYSAGFTFEVPLQRRAATANVQRRRGQIRQLSFRLRETIANLHAEVAAAVRDVETSHRELRARRAAMQAAEEYLELISNRWRALPGDGHSANVMLESVLDAQDRLLEEEIAFARSQVEYALSTTRLKRATGTLLQIQPLSATAR